MTLYVHTVFERGKPLVCAVKHGNQKPEFYPLFVPGTKLPVFDIWTLANKLKLAIHDIFPPEKIVLSGYKSYLDYWPDLLPNVPVYDMLLPPSKDTSKQGLLEGLQRLESLPTQEWQRVAGEAARVYDGLQRRGVMAGFLMQCPKWSMGTYTGRSKTSEFNLQGTTSELLITNPTGAMTDLMVCFDWAAADIRAASLLSGDSFLDELCRTGDPYAALAEHYSSKTRDMCKEGLLSAINFMDPDSAALQDFPQLRSWLTDSKTKLENGGYMETLLGRRFETDENIRRPFNASMQGTVAHAMHASLARIWKEFPSMLLAEIHDSIVLTIPKRSFSNVAQAVTKIMLRPFDGLMDTNPVFPVRVSVGKSWREWKMLRLERS